MDNVPFWSKFQEPNPARFCIQNSSKGRKCVGNIRILLDLNLNALKNRRWTFNCEEVTRGVRHYTKKKEIPIASLALPAQISLKLLSRKGVITINTILGQGGLQT